MTVLVAVLIAETLSEPKLETYTFVPSGLADIPKGLRPTGMVAMTVLVAVLITETLAEFLLDT